jgi:hypothetical protein
MNLAHLHLLVNHFPTVGTVVAIGLFIFALLGKSEELQRASLGIFLIIGLLTIPAYVTGNAAEEVLMAAQPDAPATLVDRHEDAALLAFVFMQITGVFAWFGLWQYRRIRRLTSGNLGTVLVLSLISVGLMSRAANMGGDIVHAELRVAAEPTVEAAASGLAQVVGSFVTDRTWVWPASETLHFIGMWMLFGVVLLANLRMLGFIKGVSFAAIHRMLPWGVLGFLLNLVTGMLFFISAPGYYTQNISFQLKVLFMLIAGVNAIYFTVFDETWGLKADDDAPLRSKIVAASSVAAWFAVIYFGRMLPFLGNSF